MKNFLVSSLVFLGLASVSAFAQVGMEGGSDGLHQINAKTLGQWHFTAGTGGNISVGSWGLSRGGTYEFDGNTYSYNDPDYSQAGNVFLGVGLLDFLDVGAILPLYYEHANSNGPSGSLNQWTTSRGDLDLWAKVSAPFDSSRFFGLALMLNMYVPTGEQAAGVRPRHVWYLKSGDYTSPFSADDWAFSAGLAATFDLLKVGVPFRFNLAASYLYPMDLDETNTLVYSAGANWMPRNWLDIFVEFSAEMRLQSKGEYKFSPIDDPMLITPGSRLHLPYNIDFAMGIDVAVRTFKNISFDHDKEMEGCDNLTVHYTGEHGEIASYCYASTPLISGAALLSVAFGGEKRVKNNRAEKIVLDDRRDSTHEAKPSVFETVFAPDEETVNEENTEAAVDPNKALADSLARAQAELLIADRDSDGIKDAYDRCPNTPHGIAVDSLGCMLDFDKDGVADNLDKCPNTKMGVSVDSLGCPMDFDKDGVPDAFDKCPNTPAGFEVDSTGCKMDADKDGISDGMDKCPNTPAGSVVDSLGCPMDFDKDGVFDEKDKCPNTLPGIRVDEKGCALNKKEDLNQLKKNIGFKQNSTKLTKKSFGALDDIAKLMRRIQNANLEVQVHTDDKGDDEANMKLSEKRAHVIVEYLVQHGIQSERLHAVGFGRSQPLAEGKSEKIRIKNRRVEFVPFEK